MAFMARAALAARFASSIVASTSTSSATAAVTPTTVSSAAPTITSPAGPPITSCSLVSQSATTFLDPLSSPVTLSSTIACTCNDGWGAGVGSTVGSDGSATYTCEVGTSTTIAVSTGTVPPAPLPTQCAAGGVPDASCFNALDLPDFIINWWNDNEADCGSFPGFADCWYSKMTPYSPSTCDQLNTDPACEQPKWNDFTGFNNVQIFYVTWCIWNTQGAFLDLYNAVGDASSPVSDNIGSIVTALDPPDDSTSPWEYVFDALSFGLSLYSEGTILFKALLRSAPQTSTLLHGLLFPPGDIDGDVTVWADVAGELGKFISSWQTSIGQGLPIVQDNITAFITLNQNTPLSGVRPPLDGLTDTISQSVGGYVISAILNELGLAVTRAEALDVHALQQAGNLQWDTGCEDGYDDNGICGGYFFDGTDTYSIVDPNNMQDSKSDVLQQLIGGGAPLTTGQILFTNGLQCTQTCGSNGGCAPTQDPTDLSVASCISTARVCTWTWDTLGPFQPGCDNLPSSDAVLGAFGVNPCVGTDIYGTSYSVPNTYLGGGIMDNDAPGFWDDQVVCNANY